MEELRGTLTKILYAAPDRPYIVGRFAIEGAVGEAQTIVGDLLGVSEGDEILATGEFLEHPKYGRQFKVHHAVPVLPRSAHGVVRYLSSGQIAGIGKKLAQRIVDALGAEALERILEDPDALRQVEGIGAKRAGEVREALAAHRAQLETLVFLQQLEVGPALAGRIHREYGEDTIRKVRLNPYRLAEEIVGVGFRTADRIAGALGIPRDSEERAQAALGHLLLEASGQGHAYLPRSVLLERARELLGTIAEERLDAALQSRLDQGALQRDVLPCPAFERPADPDPAIYLRPFYLSEVGSVLGIRELLQTPHERLRRIPGSWDQAASRVGLRLHEDQRRALETISREPLSILTGGPGVGKTTILRLLVEAASRAGLAIAQAAPTGRAARRMSEATGTTAQTLHRLLRFDPHRGRFGVDRKEPLTEDLVIVDEVSMMDLRLAYHLFRGTKPPTRLVLVGDANQLPSVGAGAVLRDLIASGRIPVARLTRIFRQERASRIVDAAHEILEGRVPRFPPGERDADLFFLAREGSEAIGDTIEELVTKRIPSHYGFHPVRDLQVLSPMYRGPAGVDALNVRLAAALNADGRSATFGARTLRLGEKVIQMRNDYDREVFNGDVGRVGGFLEERKGVIVEFEDKVVEYDLAALDDLRPAYAITVHRSQGSEYPVVILALANEHFVMLRRNLLYTALTRGRKLVVLVGSPRALRRAVATVEGDDRWSGLGVRLQFAP